MEKNFRHSRRNACDWFSQLVTGVVKSAVKYPLQAFLSLGLLTSFLPEASSEESSEDAITVLQSVKNQVAKPNELFSLTLKMGDYVVSNNPYSLVVSKLKQATPVLSLAG